jgi:hypothetical protein
MQLEEFTALITEVTAFIGTAPLTPQLECELNAAFPADGAYFHQLFTSCRRAIAAGAMCNREAGGIKFGRVVKPAAATAGFSVDVVDMADIAGPYHRHPNGEIDLIMPLSGDARFDGRGAGWLVYSPGSAHSPTVSHGRALVLYLLPEGSIEFTKASPQVSS